MGFFSKLKINRLRKKLKKLYSARIENNKPNLTEEMATYFTLAGLYEKNKKFDPEGIYALECYRAAAHLGNPIAQYLCAKKLIDKACFWDEWALGMFGSKVHRKYAADLFAEAQTYLIEAQTQENPLAKRLYGLCYIRGWGVHQNNDEGFRLVLDSIEQEGAWERATKIFEELGLNKSEFFSKLIARRPS